MATVIRMSAGLDARKPSSVEPESLPKLSVERAAELKDIYSLYDEDLKGCVTFNESAKAV